MKWTSSAAAGVLAIQLVQTAVLAHLLSPRDFGLMAAMLVVMGLAQAFSDMGLSTAVVVREDLSRARLSSLYWANVAAGLVVTAAVAASTPLVAAFYGEPRLNELLPWASLVFAIGAFGQQFQALLQRELRFDVLARIDVAAPFAGMCVAVATAASGAGAIALVLGVLTTTALRAALLATYAWRRWRPGLRLRRADLRGYASFGAYQMGERTLGFLAANVDYLLIGRFLGAYELGVYSIAYQLVVRPVILLNPILNRVAIPLLARRQRDDAAMRRGFAEITRLVAFLILPTMAIVAVTAPLLVPVAFGPSWEESVPVIQVLAALGAIRALGHPIGTVFLGKNRPDLGLKMAAGMLPVLALTLWLVVEQGVLAVAWAYVSVQAVSILVFLPIVQRVIGLDWRSYVRLLGAPLALTAGAVATMLAVQAALPAGAARPAALAAVVVAGAGSYAVLVLAVRRSYVAWLWSLMRQPAPPGPAASAA